MWPPSLAVSLIFLAGVWNSEALMQPSYIFNMGALLMVVIGCVPIADNNQRREEATQTTQATAAGEATKNSAQDQGPPVSGDGDMVTSPSSRNRSSDQVVNGEQDGETLLPFIAEAKAPFSVINLLSSGRLEVINDCLTVSVRGGEPATAVFPLGVKPELRRNDLVAVSFEGQRIPVGQETRIPGGGIRLESADLVKPLPSYCPKTLFGLGG